MPSCKRLAWTSSFDSHSKDKVIRLRAIGRLLQHFQPGKARSASEVKSLWKDLTGGEANKAYPAIYRLAAAGNQSVEFLKTHLPVAERDKQLIARLIAELESERFTVREKATRELEKLEELALPALRKALAAKPSLELRRRVEPLVEQLDRPILSGRRLVAVRAVVILEQIGSPEARQLLIQLAKGTSEARLTQEAKAALERLKRQARRKP